MGKKANQVRETQTEYKPTGKIKISVELIPEPEEGGFTVYCPELDIYSQGDNEKDALRNIKEAAELHIEEIGIDKLELRKIVRKELEMAL
ncbi:MAG: type II toxin-antitoxin system HicB family antitoxin [Elusimicrobiota bacterium]